MNLLAFEDFLEQTWDYVSDKVVDDKTWNTHIDLIREVTFDYYIIYKNTYFKEDTVLSPKIAGKLLESVFDKFKKFNILG